MKRTSTRNTRNVSESSLELDENQVNVGEVVQSVPVKKARSKKRKTETNVEPGPAKKPRRKRGMLKDLVEMPLDILCEIFGKLDPLDLVHVSRTTKAFRALLMSPSSKSIWKSARMNIKELPDCPDDLTEAQYAVFLFTKYCSFCLRNVAVYTSWAARVRTCKKCVEINFGYYDRLYYHREEYPNILVHWIPLVKIPVQPSKRQYEWYTFKKLDQQWEEEYKAISNPMSKIEWLNARLKERYAIEQHARKCELWYMKYRATSKSLSHYDLRLAEGKLKVAQFIEELGFGEVLAKIDCREHPHPLDEEYVKEACQNGFTDAGRAELRDRLVVTFKALQRKQEVMEYVHVFETLKPILSGIQRKAAQEYPVGTVLPTIRDIHELAEQHGFIDYSKTVEDALSVPFSEIFAMWKTHIESKLIKLMENAYGQDHVLDRNKALDLATTFFDCTRQRCPDSMRRDNVMVHECCFDSGLAPRDLPPREIALQKVFSNAEWKSSNPYFTIQFGKEEWKTMTRVVEMAGLDPKTATAKEMDELNIIYECLSCNDIDLGRATMTWAAVREHMRSAHMGDNQPPMDLDIVTGRDAKKARKRIYEAQMRKAHDDSYRILCIYCKNLDYTWSMSRYRYHLETEHQVTELPNDSELVFAPNGKNLIPPLFRLWPPRYDSSSGQAISPSVTNSGNAS